MKKVSEKKTKIVTFETKSKFIIKITYMLIPI